MLDVRFNGMVQYADVAGRRSRPTIAGASPATCSTTRRTNFKLTANYSHTYLWGIPDFGVPTDQVTREPVTESGVPRDTYYGAVNRDFTQVDAGYRHARRRVEAQRPYHAREQVPGKPFPPELHRHDPREPERQRRDRALFLDADVLLGLRPAQCAKPLRAGECHQRSARDAYSNSTRAKSVTRRSSAESSPTSGSASRAIAA